MVSWRRRSDGAAGSAPGGATGTGRPLNVSAGPYFGTQARGVRVPRERSERVEVAPYDRAPRVPPDVMAAME